MIIVVISAHSAFCVSSEVGVENAIKVGFASKCGQPYGRNGL